jgi:hypothetical protein
MKMVRNRFDGHGEIGLVTAVYLAKIKKWLLNQLTVIWRM